MARTPRATRSEGSTSDATGEGVQGIEVPHDPAAKPEVKTAPAKEADPFDDFIKTPPRLSGDFDRVVERVFTIDVLPVFDRLEAELVIGEDRSDYGTVRKHLDRAEDNARLAHKLYASARVEQEGYVIDMRPIRAAMMDRANRELQREKNEGARSKAITKEDIENWVAQNFADEYRAQEIKELKLRKTTEHMERLAELWKSRCRSLDTLLTTMRK